MSKKVVKHIYKLLGLTMLTLVAIVILKSWYVTNAAEIIYEPVYNQTEARSMLEQINEFRKGDDAWYWNSDNETKTYCTDLQDLVYDYELEKVAMQRAAEIAINWDHIRPDGREPWTAYDDCGYVWHYTVSENIAVGQTSAGMAFTAWREDNDNYSGQGHRRNMLNSDVKAIGIACVTVNGIKYWVQELAGNTPTATETVAADTAVSTKVQVSDSDITFVSCQNEELSLDVGESISVPKLIASVKFSGAWPSGKPFSVCIPGVFDTADNEYVSISDGTVVGLKAGTGTITGMFLGQLVSLPVIVNGSLDPDPEIVYVGDVDKDGGVNFKDVTTLRRYLAGGWGVELNEEESDIDGDGKLTSKDVMVLRRFLAGGWGINLNRKEYRKHPDGTSEEFIIDSNGLTLAYVQKDSDGKKLDSATWEYDEDGNKTKEIYWERNELRYTRTDYTFDDLGREETFVQTDADGTVFNCRYTYFEEPNEDGWYPTATETHVSVEGAYWMVEFFYNGRHKNEVWMDNDGNLGQKYFREDGSRESEYHKYPDGSSEGWDYNEYDKEFMYTRTDPDDNISEAHEWKYDNDGNKTQEMCWEYDELIYTRTNYKFDKYGREIEYIEGNSDGKIYTCTLAYYPDVDWPCRCFEKRTNSDGEWSVEIYRNGEWSLEKWVGKDGSGYENTYREDGSMIREIIINTDGSKTVKTYDENKNLLTTRDYAPGEEIED